MDASSKAALSGTLNDFSQWRPVRAVNVLLAIQSLNPIARSTKPLTKNERRGLVAHAVVTIAAARLFSVIAIGLGQTWVEEQFIIVWIQGGVDVVAEKALAQNARATTKGIEGVEKRGGGDQAGAFEPSWKFRSHPTLHWDGPQPHRGSVVKL